MLSVIISIRLLVECITTNMLRICGLLAVSVDSIFFLLNYLQFTLLVQVSEED